MPTLRNEKGFKFFFYSNKNAEPYHVHVEKGHASGKVWIDPSIQIAYLDSFTGAEEKDLLNVVLQNENAFKNKWYEYFKLL